MMRFAGFLLLLCGCGLALCGCADEAQLDFTLPVRVRVIDDATQESVAGVKVVVMDPAANRPVAGPLLSDAGGICDFGELAGAELKLLVYAGPDYLVLAQQDWYSWWFEGGGGSAPLVPTQLAPVPGPLPVRVAPRAQPGALPRLAGRVVDADTDEPLAQAFLSLSPFPTGYQGAAGPTDDVTGPDGTFVLYDMPLARELGSEVVFQVVPLRITRHGYRPALYSYTSRSGDTSLDVGDVLISLTPLTAADTGVLTGRVIRDGEPVAGLLVGLGYWLEAPAKGGAGLTGWTAVTDTAGVWRVSGLPPGQYGPHPGFVMLDGAVYAGLTTTPPFLVAANQETDTGDQIVLHELTPWWGRDGVYSTAPFIISWSPLPSAASYLVDLDGELQAPAPENNFTVQTDAALAPGHHSWRALALDANETIIGLTQVRSWFLIQD